VNKNLKISYPKESGIPEGFNFQAELTDEMLEHFQRDVMVHLPTEVIMNAKVEKKGDMNVLLLNLPEEIVEKFKVAVVGNQLKDVPKPLKN
jgi:hypothetical protein